jgi:trafficking protein particle complex subunit 2
VVEVWVKVADVHCPIQAFHALQTAYIRLMRNPFYIPDDHDPKINRSRASLEITSPGFIKEVQRIGRNWYPGGGV